MRIDHIAIWVVDLEKMRAFYQKYFNGSCNKKYVNPKKNFSSYFISFDNGCRIELMHKPEIADNLHQIAAEHIGLTHFAISLGSKELVDQLTEQLRSDAYSIVGEPRTTGDGYYESVILDPENNRVELSN